MSRSLSLLRTRTRTLVFPCRQQVGKRALSCSDGCENFTKPHSPYTARLVTENAVPSGGFPAARSQSRRHSQMACVQSHGAGGGGE